MTSSGIHTVYKDGAWVNEVGEAVISQHRTKDEAVAAGRVAAIERKTEHVIHNLDGTIAGRNSYGDDPKRSVG